MLLRTYRLTDKTASALLKLVDYFSAALAGGVLVLLGSATGQRRGLLGVLGVVLGIIARLLLLIGAGAAAMLAFILRLTGRVGGLATSGTTRTVSGAMARRSARAQMDASVTEDPLRAQNRVLSALFVVVLVALIGMVLFATRPQPEGVTPGSVAGLNLNLANTVATNADTAGALVVATSAPTATQLPDALQALGSVAFTVRQNGQTDLWAVGIADSRSPARLTNGTGDERDPSWSPDGRRLAYAANQDGNWELYVYDILTNITDRKTFDLAFQGAPTWSPDNFWLVYESYQGDNLDIFILAVDGSEPTRRLPGSSDAPDFSPVWSPDGRYIAFTSWMDGASQDIYIFNLDTLETFNLTNTPDRNEDFAVWYPAAEGANAGLLAYSAVDAG
ncbi:MAG: PD40 domain-containing protein, partial [Armatimonadetes bacterium]|nr:PD40 domain-containing protein [Anaerolineae bacterium]